ncbi:thiamine pyrophosphate-dependent enzyme, possible carboligase or decarboxylase [Rhizobium leguminosarum bv. trifolii WSM597]|uniref:Thiamine pyrophosphate-dependent enzyme, possible carboligase or decarboxylase n=1 Tax=Rhizobium leguminosarum bv. trifolii WSM597 TaxID=754764 RepID=I9NJV3_RHILT|nr:5-guanidino-2-oxopentanoate decarboxylase [Rhizobium leguminosarum]EJB07017.1 thiamine pyrophosphate-dependent enzyme, possible carboligase or decarboxylase [Rhizobium leguminosarum bv. trifolii WSM597]
MSVEAAIQQTTVADAILRLMETYEVDTIFSIPGVHTVDFYKSLPDRAIRHITPRHEQGAAFMAYGYAFATGRPAACMLITGPGVLNAATGIAEAYADSIPMLVIAANNLIAEIGVGRGALHETKSQAAVQEQISAFSHTLLDAANVEEVFHRAMSLIHIGRPRPSLIEVPRDLLASPAPVPSHPKPAIYRPGPQPEAISKAASLLSGAKRPLIIAGGGARFAATKLVQLAERLDIPVVTTNTGKGILPESHALSLGSGLPFEATGNAIADADVVLAIGTELGETDLLYTCRSYRINGTLIRIDIDPRQLTINHLPVLAILSDAGAALDALLQATGQAQATKAHAARERVAEIRSRIAKDPGWSAESHKHKRVLDVIAGTLSEDAIICADSTQLAYTGNHYYPTATPGTWLFPNGYGTLGSAMPAAVGARIGRPDREVLAIVGDGSFLYSIEELTTAVENGIGLPVIVWNNRAYGEIRDAMIASGIPTVGVDLYTPDFLTIARGFGCHAVQIESLDQLAGELRGAFDRAKPSILLIDSEAVMFSENGA